MPTNVFTKRAFIAMIEKEMGDKQLVVATSIVNGTIQITKKQLKIPFAFDATAFKDQGVGHIVFGESWCISACILEPERVSDLGLSLLIKSPKDGTGTNKKTKGTSRTSKNKKGLLHSKEKQKKVSPRTS